MTEVRAGGTGGEGQIHAVVYEHRDGQGADQRPGEGEDLPRLRLLEPHFHRGRAAAHGTTAGVDGVPPLE